MTVFAAVLSSAAGGAELQNGSILSESQEIHHSDDKSDRREARKIRRQQRMEEWKRDMAAFNREQAKDHALVSLVDSMAGVQALAAIDQLGFVLEADYVTFKRGNRVTVNSGTTFISLDGDRAVVQISPSQFYSGPNGMGGVTVTGRATEIRTSKTKNGETVLNMNVTGVGINAMVEIHIPEGTNRAYATVTPNFNSNTIRLEGQMVPYNRSRTVEGMSL